MISCGGSQPEYITNTELVVHYEGKEVYRRVASGPENPLSYKDLNTLVATGEELILIFSADWCNACSLTKKALKQANLNKKVYYLNIDDDWVKKLASIMKISSVPTMLHTNSGGDVKKILIGPSDITLYLLLNFSKTN